MAKITDPNFVNSWGMALGLNSGLWVAENGTGMAAAFDGAGQAISSGSPQVITIPGAGGMGSSSPTGVATNGMTGFVISSAGKSASSAELFATEDGTISGWNSDVDPTQAIIAIDNSALGAIYKGLAIGFNAKGAFLFATNFHAGTVDVFDSSFHPVSVAGGFRDPNLPAGYAPFGISAINSHLYVTYALQDANKKDDVAGPGHGFIDIFDTDGNLLKRFTSQGQLNSPWGMAWAPFEGFGNFNNALFVGNFGDGSVNAFDFDSGEFLGAVSDANNQPIKIPGVWALEFGLGVANSSSSTLFFTAGIEGEQHGLFGTFTVNPSSLPPPEGPTLLDSNLQLTTVVSGLDQPTSMAFLGANDLLILEKATGKVQHVVNGVVHTVLTLPVNSASERGLLGIALQPDFANTHGIYLYWTQSKSGTVSSDITDVPLLGNRVDRYVWDPAMQTLTFDKNIIMLHAFQADAGQPQRGNHDAGKILFGPDGKLYFQIGDQGRRGQLQNLASGPLGPGQPDDQFGGPAPDDAHLTGVIFRLNADGTTPSDNPFANVTTQQIAQLEQQAGVTLTSAELDDVVANIHKIFSYGRRNGFGLAFDPMTGFLWESENGDDAFDEMNRITAGSNGGWIQIMGPASRVAEFQQIESSFTPLQGNLPVNGNLPFSPIDPTTFIPALQQVRWPPSLIAGTSSQALQRLFVLPGSHYDDPEFSWRWAVAPAGIGFAGSGLGPAHANDLFVGGARTFLDGGYLFEFKFDPSRQHFAFSDPKLADMVDDNDYKFDEGESASLVAGKNFGIVTNIVTGPDGNLYVTSLTNGAVYMITAAVRQSVNQRFVAQVYRDLLHREADPGGLAAFSGLLDQGSSTRAQVVRAIETSREYRTGVVQSLYQKLLGRGADPTGLNGWVGFLEQGGTMEQLEAFIIGSEEYFARRANKNNASFLRAAYLDVLGRAIDPTGAQGWGNQLQQDVSRSQVAKLILSSLESDRNETENLYNQFLHRAADPGGLNALTAALQKGLPNEVAIAIIVGSEEYVSRV